MIGLACARPAIGVCQRMFSPVVTFQFVTSSWLWSRPLPSGPRNCGQFPAANIGRWNNRKVINTRSGLTGGFSPLFQFAMFNRIALPLSPEPPLAQQEVFVIGLVIGDAHARIKLKQFLQRVLL